MSRKETVGAPLANGVATKPDLVLDANVARMIRSNALDEARRVVARQLHLVPACDVDPVMACLRAIDELRGAS